MSLYSYLESQKLETSDHEALLMRAIINADDINMFKFEAMWPELVEETKARYNAPGGRLEGEK